MSTSTMIQIFNLIVCTMSLVLFTLALFFSQRNLIKAIGKSIEGVFNKPFDEFMRLLTDKFVLSFFESLMLISLSLDRALHGFHPYPSNEMMYGTVIFFILVLFRAYNTYKLSK